MPGCSIKQCGARKSKNRPNLTLHSLPRNEVRRRQWLNAIGQENINPRHTNVRVCSLHFEETEFNRTLDLIRLRDGAVPTLFNVPQMPNPVPVLGTHGNIPEEQIGGISQEILTPSYEMHGMETSTRHAVQQAVPGTSAAPVLTHGMQTSTRDVVQQAVQAVPGTSAAPVLTHGMETSTRHAIQQAVPGTSAAPVLTHGMETSTRHAIQQAIPGTSAAPVLTHGMETSTRHAVQQAVPGTSAAPVLMSQASKVKKLEEKCDSLRKKVKRLTEKVRRQKKKIAEFQNIIKDLQERNLVNNECSIVLEACAGPKDFLKRQIMKSQGLPLERQYSEETRKFALTLHFFSPKAYDFVRRTYNTCLPHPRTLTKWYQKINAEPGFCKEAFDALKMKVESSDMPVVCALSFDEMSIRKSLCWDAQTKTYYGRVTMGADCDNDSMEVANQCLVFLLTCVNGGWKLPVAYLFITSLTGEQKAECVKMCVQKCEEVGVKIVSVTCDGPAANFSMFSELGCQLSKDQNVTTFDCSKSTLHAFIDPCHAIKLVRNTFGDLRLLYDMYGRKIDYNYLELLLKIQDSEGLHLANKITKAHLHFAKQKMKVRLATQLLSNSVADALEFCKTDLQMEEFKDCEGTINFVRIFNDIFDVLNSHSVRPPGWKKAICPENVGLVEALFEGAIGYISNLKLPTGELLIKSKRKTGFIGMIINMKSALNLYRHLVEDSQILKYLPMYKMSQDHVELFFSAIRARGGFNNNPNAVQFKAAFKRLLIRAEIRDGGLGNCIPLEQISILNCSSKDNPVHVLNNLTERSSFVEIPEDDSSLYEEYIDCLNSTLSQYSESVVTYIAGFVAKKLARTIKCENCNAMLFGEPNDYERSLIKVKSRGGLKYPSKDLENITRKTEKIIKPNLNKNMPQNYYLYIFKFVMDYFESTHIFESDSHHDSNHKYLLIKSVIQTYLDIRFRFFGKKLNDKVSFRNYLNKIILFRNE